MQSAMKRLSALVGLAVAMPFAAPAQEAAAPGAPSPGLHLSLNSAATEDGNCVLSFVLRNTLGSDIDKAVYETVLFSAEGRVERLMLLDMGKLPDGRPRVVRFRVGGTACEALGSVLINGAETCEAGDLGGDVCISNLNVSSETSIGIEG